uniref:NACHT domain-containing protein n=1 Tax=Oncorhynchus kisutch TaxID=8019 RepID=A0A8C7KQW1_ONCKI
MHLLSLFLCIIILGAKPCHRYQSQLKCKARKITEAAWKQSCSLLPERCRNEVTFSYTPLVLDTDVPSSLSKIETKSKRCKKVRPKKLKSFIPVAKQETSPADLLKTPKRRILLVGKPGIGKTAVAHQMLNLWAQKDHRELDYMFYFDVRDISPSTHPMRLEDLLFNMYSEPEESREEVLQDIKKNSENVVIIFDGITDLSSHSVIKKLVDKDLLLDAKIVITCRPEVPSGDFLTDWLSFRVEVKGFSNESIRAYLTKMLSAEPNPTPNHDSLSIVLNNLELFSLCHVPMYALMVVACMYYSTPEASKQPWPTTKMYINILRYCILKHSGKQMNDLDKCLAENREKILSLAEMAFDATQQKTMNLTELSCEVSSVQFSFLGALMIMVEPTVSDTYSAFLHYTMQEFFGALWLLQNPDRIREVLQKCQTEEWKHTKHMVPFMCGLLNERNIPLVNGLVPAQQIKKTSDWFFKEVVNTFLPLQANQDHAEGGAPEFERDLLFLCQCLYESQSTEACLLLLDKLDYNLDLDEEHLDPHQCCAVSYMISQSAERKVDLDLNSCTVSDQGLRLILGSLKNVRYLRSDPSMLCQLWTTLLRSEADIDFTSLLGLCGNELHLPFQGERRVFERAEEVMKQSLERVNLCIHWDRRTLLSEALSKTMLKCLTHINKLHFTPLQDQRESPEKLEKEEKSVLLDLCLQAGLCHRETFQGAVNTLLSLFSVNQTERYDILLDLYSHVKYNRKQAGRSILPALQPLYQPAPAVWFIDLSERKASLLLEVLKLQPEKKSIELKGWSDEEIELRSFLQCLPYISQLSFYLSWSDPSKLIKFLVGLLSQAAEWEEQSGEKTLKLVSSVCTYSTFPFCDGDDEDKWFQCDFLLDLCSHVKDYETQTGRSVLPALQTVYQSAPAVWSIDLRKRKVSLLLEVLKLQPEKKPVELKGWSDEESEVRSFLQCLPYISQLSCDSDRFFQRVCESIPVRSREDAQQLASLLQALSSTLSLGGQLPRKTCRSVVRVLGLCASRVDLTLTPSKISLKGASHLFTHVSQLHKVRLNVGMAVRLARLARRTGRGGSPLTVPELSLVLKSSQPPERVLSRALSSVASLLRLWTVQCLDLTDFCIQGHSVITLLCHQGPLTLRLHSDTLQQLAVVVYEAQDKDLTRWFLEKIGGDLTSCRLDWEVLLSLLQHSTHNITVDLRKNRLLEKNISDLLPFLGRVIFKRLSSSFVKSTIRQIYDSRASDCVSSLLRSSDHWINLNSRELDRVDCTALCFTLQHSHQVKVNLLWTSIPPGEIESILPLLDRVSQLSVDRMLLLSFLHSCAASQILQGALSPPSAITTAAAELLRALQHRLDFSCSSFVDLSAHDQGEALCLTTDHCRAINSVLKQSQHCTQLVQNQSRNQPQMQLILTDCEVEHGALRELLPILHIVKLSPSKALLLQLLDHVCEGIEEGVLSHAVSLCRALDGELDLSETRLNQKACGSLALVLEHSEGLSELDLSHCQLTDRHLQPLLTHLHRVEVLDLSHNDITDALTDRILQLVSTNTSIRTVRLFSNTIKDRSPFLTDKRFEIW